ncbi:MAG: hypothetical protein QOD69_2475 [Solirubrobacteraceae bacterium]|jgi:hypothetical protein|nr:hypothetical protein [Solirubrobacteraceae bacterium]
MTGDMQQRDEERVSRAALKARVAGIVTAGVVVSLVLVPDAFARIISNHNETVLAFD